MKIRIPDGDGDVLFFKPEHKRRRLRRRFRQRDVGDMNFDESDEDDSELDDLDLPIIEDQDSCPCLK
jgi:hypothetical protein